ncbi:MAG: dihydropteroate synthase [Pelistega sp.]|nr:dihydropteroate synthase [Pelistega sp.]
MSSLFQCGRFELRLDRPFIMGIVNVTPDSFSDGNHHFSTQAAIEHGLQLVAEGAEFLDVGGESTRPGSEPVSIEDELRRIIPVIEGLRACGVPLSIDTFKPEVMDQALAAGADLINDIYALRQEGALEVLAKYPKAGVCIMHMHGDPKTMQNSPPDYDDAITQHVYDFLDARIQTMLDAGITKNRIMIDPGFGFGKTMPQNYQLLAEMSVLKNLDAPILIGVSRKSMIGYATNQTVENRTVGSVVAALAAADRGAVVLRVHDVQATRDGLNVWNAINKELNHGS